MPGGIPVHQCIHQRPVKGLIGSISTKELLISYLLDRVCRSSSRTFHEISLSCFYRTRFYAKAFTFSAGKFMKLERTRLLLIVLLCLPFAALSQSTLVKINPLGLPLVTVNGSVEQYLANGIGLQLGAYYTTFRFKEANYSGWAVTPELRFYLKPISATPEGWYIAPFARYSLMNISREASVDKTEVDGSARFLGGGAVVGRQWLLGEQKQISVDVFAGPKYSEAIRVQGSAQKNDFDAQFVTKGFWLRSGITIGIGFFKSSAPEN